MKYIVKDDFTRDGIRQFAVREEQQEDWQAVAVWVSVANPEPRCCSCSTILVAMSASCPHAKAVKRWLKNND